METKKAYSMVCGYFEYLKVAGSTSPCDVRKLLISPLLVDMTEGDLAVYATADERKVLDRIALSLFL